MKAILFQRLIHLARSAMQARKNPSRFQCLAVRFQFLQIANDAGLGRPFHLHEDEARSVPDLVGESAVAVGTVFAESNIGSRRSHSRQSKAHRIGAKRSTIWIGSMTFPLVFDIFCRSASRTSAWIYTSRNGTASLRVRLLPSGIGSSSMK